MIINCNEMEMLADILTIILPAVAVLITAVLITGKMVKNEKARRDKELTLEAVRTVLPIRLQAYERIVLFLERISMESLLMRSNTTPMSAQKLHGTLLNTIRSEYEHNLSQQLYISADAWEVVRSARSNMVKIINGVAKELPKTATSMDLGKNLLEEIMSMDREPTKAAIDHLKQEAASLF